jgi:hypothetical protein
MIPEEYEYPPDNFDPDHPPNKRLLRFLVGILLGVDRGTEISFPASIRLWKWMTFEPQAKTMKQLENLK